MLLNWLKVISCQEQNVRLLVVIHHENIKELSSKKLSSKNYKVSKTKSRTPEHIKWRKEHEHMTFFFLETVL